MKNHSDHAADRVPTNPAPGTLVYHESDPENTCIGTIVRGYNQIGFVSVKWDTPFETIQGHHVNALRLAVVPGFMQPHAQ